MMLSRQAEHHESVDLGYAASVAERLRRRTTVDAADCWTWQGETIANGYGRIKIRGFQTKCLAHRVAYIVWVGPIPDGLTIDHLCRNRACCNPDHLEPVTRYENLARGTVWRFHSAKTHCPHGHEYSPQNTYRHAGKRHCRACRAASDRARRSRRAAA